MTRDLMVAADRMWEAAYALDALYGHRKVSGWTAERVRMAIRDGRASDPKYIGLLAEALERRLMRVRDTGRS